MKGKVLLYDMTYEDARDAFKEADFIVLPTGSIEQHSIHLPLSVDSIRAEKLTEYLVNHSDGLKMVMMPPLYYGQSLHHIHFPGTISLQPETYIHVLKDLAWSVKYHGAKRLLIINYHGGNVAPIEVARLMIEREIGLKVYYAQWSSFAKDLVDTWFPGVHYGHACFSETSFILHFRPDLVVKEKMRKQEVRFLRSHASSRPHSTRGTEAAYWDDNYITGGIGDPTLARAELAEKIIPQVTKRIIETLKEDMKYEYSP